MHHYQISALALAVIMVTGAGGASAQGRAQVGTSGGEVLATHSCLKHGYTLRVIRPSSYNENSDARQIQVHYNRKSFHATWNEVSNLIGNYMPDELEYFELASNPGANGKRFCARTGHLIPTHETVYQVQLDHANDYNGDSTVFFDSNAEASTLTYLVSKYNNSRNQGDALPPSCNIPCFGGSSGVSGNGSSGSGWRPGTYTTADGEAHDLNDLNPPGNEGSGGNPVRPSVDAVERSISRPAGHPVGGITVDGNTGGVGDRKNVERQRLAP
jgi:hypothetical protein